jgi:short-subunit dehydrogenase
MHYALITGASGGIGLCLAKQLAQKGYNLLLIARSSDKLSQLKVSFAQQYGVDVHYLTLDISSNESHKEIIQWVSLNNWSVTILINNAGYGLWESVENASLEALQNMIQLNTTSLVNLCHSFIPILKKSSQSYIMNVASTASYQAVPYLSTYAATKAFVVLFSRGLKWELINSPISVTCLSPGATSTGFIDRAGMDKLKEKAEKLSMKPEEVAKIAINAMFNKKAEVIPGFTNWLSVKLTYLLPKLLVERVALALYKK